MAIKKYTNGSWAPASYRKYGTETDAITTLPATVIGDSTPISSYTIKGNMEQTGTPTPSSPIYPSECGERTENLFDKNNYNLVRANAGTGQSTLYGNPNTSPYAVYIPVTGGETYSFYSQATLSSSCFTMATPAIGVSIVVNGANTFNSTSVRTAPADAKYLVMFLETSSATQDIIDSDLATLTVIKSSTVPTSYIPYGYKLPLTSAGQNVDIYLGECETTRRIKKLVLTGGEGWLISSSWKGTTTSVFYFNNYTVYTSEYNVRIVYSDRFLASTRDELCNGDSDMSARTGTNSITFRVSDSIASTLTGWMQYLAAQYAAGTPVTVWYVLAEPETAVVNEPLMKIGDYADTVSMEQAGVEIPTNKGSTTLDVDTTLKPSEFELTYHGWHEHKDTKFTT